MGLETPRSGTLHEAQQKVVNLLTPGGVPTEGGNPPEEQQETQVAQDDLMGQLEEESQDLESEEESPDYNEDDEEVRTFKIRVKGQDKEVTESELIKLASMGEDYTKKTQDLSEQRKRLELIAQDADAARGRMSQVLPELESNLLSIKKQLESEPDWDALYKADPIKAARLQRQFDKKKVENTHELKTVQAEQQRLQAENDTRIAQAKNEFLIDQGKLLLEKIPQWKEDKVAISEKTEIEKWVLSNDYLDQNQLNNIMDWGSVAIMRKAWLYDQGKAKVAKQRSKSTRTLSPGSKGSAPKRDSLKSKRETFAKTGKSRDAQALVQSILNRKKSR
tara:strand:- start:966 stop:1967 length:1002 start_codon:yes stop_codon:yes gene_type:complete